MRSRTPLLCLALAALALGAAGSASHAEPPAAPLPRPVATAMDAPLATATSRDPRVDADPSTYSSCAVPSVLRLHAADDARDLDGLAACAPTDAWAHVMDRDQVGSLHCASAGRPVDVARILEGALPLDAATTAHVRAVVRAGQAQGRHAGAFGLVGDSMTVDGNFMRPFRAFYQSTLGESPLPAASRPHVVIPAELQRVLSLGRFSPSSFVAPRAAKVGVRAVWPLERHYANEPNPLEAMVAAESPAYAVVLYGANDALWRTDSLDLLRGGFRGQLGAVVDALEARGVVPILTTIPKHMRQRGWPDCSSSPTGGCNERFAVQATVLSAEVASLACSRHLPLIDLRWALDPLVYHGVGADGVHLSVHPDGGGVLDAAGLACGYNVRNLVTLRELARVVDAATW
jgi:hypothetical protein